MASHSVKKTLESSESSAETAKPETSDAEQEGPLKRIKAWAQASLRGRSDGTLKEALEEIIEEHAEEGSQLPPQEQHMLKNILTFGELTVADIMVPRPDINAVESGVSLAELKAHIVAHRHTRIPVYQETLDVIQGFVHIKDMVPMLSGESPFNVMQVMRDILFVPPSMKLASLMLRMRIAGVHIAIVVDEYGGTDGLVTLEDMFEEIVGDIQDEHDEAEKKLSWHGTICEVDARVRIEQLEEDLKLHLKPSDKDHDYDTLGGFIFQTLGSIPARGQIITHESGARFEILTVDPRRIHKIRIHAPIVM